MTSDTGDPNDEIWRRPTARPGPAPGAAGPGPGAPGPTGPYGGPPSGVVPPPGWRPPVHVQPPPPGVLPAQDLDALRAAESQARTVTYGFALAAAVVGLLLLCVLCGRLLG